MLTRTPMRSSRRSVRNNMRSNLLLTLGLAILIAAGACTDAAKPPVVVKSSPTPAAPAADHDHLAEQLASRISLADAKKEYDAGTAVIVDVRDPGAYRVEHVKDSINITQPDLETAKIN